MANPTLRWQSKLVLLLVLPAAAASTILLSRFWATDWIPALYWSLGLPALLGLIAWRTRSATPDGAFAGALVTACLMLETFQVNAMPWQTGLTPVLAVLLLTGLATRLGRARKRQLGLAESPRGRNAAQVAANSGLALWLAQPLVQLLLLDSGRFAVAGFPQPILAPALAVLAESAADTVSSEIGQVLGGRPRLITTLRLTEPGENGAISLAGTAAGILAAALVALAGAFALALFPSGRLPLFLVTFAGGVFGLFFDSLLGATLERHGWLSNDLVNFLSTASAAAAAFIVLALIPHTGVG